ncbi:MAG TPA: hypothetical protein VII30_01315 [Gemmatimonadaceae bacterium]
MHTRLPLAALALMLCAAPALAQQGSPNTTPGAVTRVVLIHIKAGHGDPFWADLRQHGKPVWDEEKRLGLITDYTVATKPTLDSPEDWNVALTFTYPNWATLDNLTSRTDAITLAHYGSAPNRAAAGLARAEHANTVATFLLRDQTLNPWK